MGLHYFSASVLLASSMLSRVQSLWFLEENDAGMILWTPREEAFFSWLPLLLSWVFSPRESVVAVMIGSTLG